jgi:hypothetical protein
MTPDTIAHAPVIGLIGQAGSGKTAVRNILCMNIGVLKPLSFATPLKNMTYRLIESALPKNWHTSVADYLSSPELKNAPIPFLLNLTPRQLMQTLGTEWGRNTVHQDLWVALAAQRVERFITSTFAGTALGPKVVFDDVRFQNEADMIRTFGGVIVRVYRPDNPNAIDKSHASEQEASSLEADLVLVNDGTLEDLVAKVSAIWPPTQPKSKAGPGRPRKTPKPDPDADTDHL